MKIEPSQKSLKSGLRSKIRKTRSGIDPQLRKKHDDLINHHLLDYLRNSNHGIVAAYAAFDGEPDLMPALGLLEAEGLTIALPVVQDEPGRSVISFRKWSSDSPMKSNRYGIREPVDAEEIIMPDIDVALIPLVAWDENRYRLGMGASFYDRLFQPYSGLKRPERIGVGYQAQKVDRVPKEPWDVPMHAILSESGIYK